MRYVVAQRWVVMSAAVNNTLKRDTFTRRYRELLDHYGMKRSRTQAGKAHENGDVEQAHHRLKRAIEQELLLRGSRDFLERKDYERFIQRIIERRNAGRQKRLDEELKVMRRLPNRRLEDFVRFRVKVSPSSTIRVRKNTYSVDNEGEILEFLVQLKRNAQAALKWMHKLLKKQGWPPTRITTDKLRSYHVVIRTLGLTAQHIDDRRATNRAENSHQPVRRRERKQQRFKSPGSAQRFLDIQFAVYNTFYVQRHLCNRFTFKRFRKDAFNVWDSASAAA